MSPKKIMDEEPHLLSSQHLNYKKIQENIFLEEESLKLSFRETFQIINTLGNIFKIYITDGDRVAVFLPRSAESAIAIYSILYTNAIYVPLNTTDPTERITFILNNTNPKLIIGKGNKPDWAENFIWYDISQNDLHNASRSESKLHIRRAVLALATILHTSGSTGTPKGVALSHKAMIAFSDWAGTTFKINESDIIANLAPFYFDLSVFDLYTSFRFGSRLTFIPQHLTLNPVGMTDWLLSHKVTVWYTVPSVLAFLLNKGDIKKLNKSNLRLILFAGEPISKQILLNLLEVLPNVKFYNLYGPVETNVCCFWEVNYSLLKKLNYVPIGISACGDELKIDSSTNELMVQGPSLMSGYWEKGLKQHMGWYRTGDIVYTGEKDLLVYKGRQDRMFKYNGYRVEPFEIENRLLLLPDIIEASVCLIKDDIIACVSAQNIITREDLIKFLSKALPHYMIPSKILYFSTLPKLSNGKVDLIKLKIMLEESSYNKLLLLDSTL